MSLRPELEALKAEALATSCIGWATRKRWKLSPGLDRAGPCPVCGGTDRFAIHTGKDTFNCRKCGLSGHGVIDLVVKTEHVEFVPACEIITGRKASTPVDPARAEDLRKKAAAEDERQRKIEESRRAAAIAEGQAIVRQAHRPSWADAADRGVAGYLRLRGVDLATGPVPLDMVRIGEIDAHPWTEPFRDQWGRMSFRTLAAGPAMIAAVQGPDGTVIAAHQTWIDISQPKGKLVLPPDDAGKDRAAKKTRGSVKGGAIRLYTPAGARRIVMGEGIETTLTALRWAFEPDTAYWAGVTAGNMAGKAARDTAGKIVADLPDLEDTGCFVPPSWAQELIYLCDGDGEASKIEAKMTRGLIRAQALRERARRDDPTLPGLDCAYVEPVGDGRDLNDLVRVAL